ncbi:MAG: topoisomerase IV, partial [Oscillospiraceae bacterium]|nr:topoisomerase IV [Oscillospiraceae bacterium]
ILFLTDRQQMYKCRVSDFEDSKASVLGVYIPTRLKMDEGESVIVMIDPNEYKGSLLFFFENGKAARIELTSYETKTNRKKLINAYCDKSPLVSVLQLSDDIDVACYASDDRVLVFNTSMLQTKTSRNSQGVGVMSLKAKRVLKEALPLTETQISNVPRYRVRSLPAAGALLKTDDREEQQLSLLDDQF